MSIISMLVYIVKVCICYDLSYTMYHI